MQINLPDDTAALVQSQAAAAGFGSDVAGYIARLIVQDIGTHSTEEIERCLEEGFASGDSGRSLGEVAEQLKQKITAEMDR